MGYKLAIEVKSGSQNALVGFPYLEGQFYDGTEDDQSEDSEWLYVNLNGRKDNSVAQGKFLDGKPEVISYSII